MRRLLRLPPAALLLLGAASLPAAPSLLAGDDGGAGPRALVKGIAGSFDVFDADADGRIAEEELPLGDLFTAIDADRDGFLLPAELKAWLDAGEKEGEGGMAPPAEETFLDRARRIVATDPRFNASARRAEFLRNFDRDPKDGRIQRAEHAGDDGDRVFRKFDRDRNGALDDRELLSLAREQVAELAKSRRRPDRANFLYLFDLDQDRKVTKEEYALLKGPASTFTAYDLEADGVVTDDEVRYPERYRDAREGRGRGREAAGAAAEDRSLFDLYDKDGDRRVTPTEFGGGEAVFRRLDRDRDGVLTPADG